MADVTPSILLCVVVEKAWSTTVVDDLHNSYALGLVKVMRTRKLTDPLTLSIKVIRVEFVICDGLVNI